jgi:branched-chain amino acid transport system substrate-binding protein
VLFGGDGLLTIGFLSNPATAGMFLSGPDLRFDGNAGFTGVTYPDLLARYEERFGETPPAGFHAHAYDATMLLLAAIETVSIEDGGDLVIGREALRDFLFSVEGFPGVTGTLDCDEFGDCGAQAVAIFLNDDPADPEATFDTVVFSQAGL